MATGAKTRRVALAVAGVVLLVAAGSWLWWPEEPPEPAVPDVAAEDDPSREETEAFMREIGYVQ